MDFAGELLLVSPVEQVQEPLGGGSPGMCAWASLHPAQSRPPSRAVEALPLALGLQGYFVATAECHLGVNLRAIHLVERVCSRYTFLVGSSLDPGVILVIELVSLLFSVTSNARLPPGSWGCCARRLHCVPARGAWIECDTPSHFLGKHCSSQPVRT